MLKLKKIVVLTAVLILLLISIGVPAAALEDSKYSVKTRVMENNLNVYELVINEQVVIRFRSMSQGLTAAQRAAVIMERINNMGLLFTEKAIHSGQKDGWPVVFVEDKLLLTVTRDDWEANNSTGPGLATVWAQNLMSALRNPYTGAVGPVQQVPPGGQSAGVKTIQPVAASQEETSMLGLINKERSKAGLQPLVMDGRLTALARLKSGCIIENNYFSHISPVYGDPITMLKDYGIKYSWAGENLAGNQTVEIAHQALMNSLQHRKNILNPNFTHVGIGIISGGPYGKVFTQLFIGTNT